MQISLGSLATRARIGRQVSSDGGGTIAPLALRLPKGLRLALAAGIAVIAFAGCSGDSTSDPNDPNLVGAIDGTVKDIARIPLTGMRVSVVGGTTQFPEIGVVTDLNGRFVIAGLLPGTFDLAVFDKGGRRLAVATVRVKQGQVSRPDFVLGIRGPIVAVAEAGEEAAPTSGSIEGVITDPNEAPVPGLTVRIADGSTDFPDTPSVTDSEGRYQIAPVPLGTFQISVQEPDGKRVGLGLARVTSDEPVVQLHFRAKLTGTFSGSAQGVSLETCEGLVDPLPPTLALKTAGDTPSAQAEDASILSRCAATVTTAEGSKVAVMTIVRFNAPATADGRYDALRSDLGAEADDEVLGARSFSARAADGRYVVFQKGEHVVTVSTTLSGSQAPAGVQGDLGEFILALARTALSRLP